MTSALNTFDCLDMFHCAGLLSTDFAIVVHTYFAANLHYNQISVWVFHGN